MSRYVDPAGRTKAFEAFTRSTIAQKSAFSAVKLKLVLIVGTKTRKTGASKNFEVPIVWFSVVKNFKWRDIL